MADQIYNQPHDEEVNLTDEDDDEESPKARQAALVDEGDDDGLYEPETTGPSEKRGGIRGGDSPPANVSETERDDSDEEEEEEGNAGPGSTMISTGKSGGSGDGPDTHAGDANAYNAEDYADLDVTDDVKELFQYIGRYKPTTVTLDSKLKPFIPEYIPAVGDIDEFIKVPRPDGKADDLGLKVLDEPAANQSDAIVLNLQLRAVSKQSNLRPMEVASVQNAEKDPKRVTQWIQSIQDLHKSKPAPTVSYSKNMPDIETLMEAWPAEVEEVIRGMRLPDENLPVDLKEFVKLLCGFLDIPTYTNASLVESLHVMLTLYLEFKNNPMMRGASNFHDDASMLV
mmetsp:Transcript_25222/g.82793  ORF Transcript_25222/g.82793 Transcript_25222/m.82793 type:complete len:341 (-) Transcript_25222:1144-2166(-)